MKHTDDQLKMMAQVCEQAKVDGDMRYTMLVAILAFQFNVSQTRVADTISGMAMGVMPT